MSDILGSALQRLASAESASLTTNSSKQFDNVAEQSACRTALPDAAEQHSHAAEVVLKPFACPTVDQVESSAFSDSVPRRERQKLAIPERINSGFAFVRTHRRQSAAAFVLFGMALIWFDGGLAPDTKSTVFDDSDALGVESLLDEFDAASSAALREPAEPIETVENDVRPMTIPQSGNTDAFSQFAQPSATVAVYPDDATVPSESSQLEFRSQRPPEASSRKNVHFTGQIQPLK